MTETSTPSPTKTLVAAPDISIVIPVYNEEQNLPLLFQRLCAVVDKMGRPCEIVFTDDGSKDNSLALLKVLSPSGPISFVWSNSTATMGSIWR